MDTTKVIKTLAYAGAAASLALGVFYAVSPEGNTVQVVTRLIIAILLAVFAYDYKRGK